MIIELKNFKLEVAAAVEAASSVPGQHDKESATEDLKGLDARVGFEIGEASLDVTPEEFKEVVDLMKDEVKARFEARMQRAHLDERAAERAHEKEMKAKAE